MAAGGLVVGRRLLANVSVGARISGGLGNKVSVGEGWKTASRTGVTVGVGEADGALIVIVEEGMVVAVATTGLSGVNVESEIPALDGRSLDPATRLANPTQ